MRPPDSGTDDRRVRSCRIVGTRSPDLKTAGSGVRDFPDSGIPDRGVRSWRSLLIPSPEYTHYRTNVHIGAINPGIRSPDSLNAESGAIDPGIRSPDSLNAESGPGVYHANSE